MAQRRGRLSRRFSGRRPPNWPRTRTLEHFRGPVARKLTPAVVEKIRARKAQGLSNVAIAQELALSHGSVGNALRMAPTPKAPPKRPTGEKKARKSDSEAPTPAALMAMAWKTAQRLDRWSDEAQDDRDQGAFKALAKDLLAAVKELSKLLPPVPLDPETDPDLVAAAEEARGLVRELVERKRGT